MLSRYRVILLTLTVFAARGGTDAKAARATGNEFLQKARPGKSERRGLSKRSIIHCVWAMIFAKSCAIYSLKIIYKFKKFLGL